MPNQMLRLIMLGAPAAGKGTISKRILAQYGKFVHISPGDILRLNIQQGTRLGHQAKVYIERGVLVPDEHVMQCVLARLAQTSAGSSWILDGFPRTLEQAQLLQASTTKHPIDAVFNLIVPDQVIIERIRNRWIHLPSGRVYSSEFNKPRQLWKDDITGEDLVQRTDDLPKVVEQRLRVYRASTRPVFEYYRQLGVDVLDLAGASSDVIWSDVREYLKKKFGLRRTQLV